MTTERVPTALWRAGRRNDGAHLHGTKWVCRSAQDDVQLNLIDHWFLELSLPFHQTKVGLKWLKP